MLVIACSLVMVGFFFVCQYNSSFHEKSIHSIKASIAISHRPRVVYFFANWCGACKHYGPLLNKCVAVYGKTFDFQSVNVEDPLNIELWEHLHTHSIPATCIFNSKGDLVLAFTGCMNELAINDSLRSIYLETLNRPAKIKSDRSLDKPLRSQNTTPLKVQ
jgi:thioredoxin-like negative regulator of GroEL